MNISVQYNINMCPVRTNAFRVLVYNNVYAMHLCHCECEAYVFVYSTKVPKNE